MKDSKFVKSIAFLTVILLPATFISASEPGIKRTDMQIAFSKNTIFQGNLYTTFSNYGMGCYSIMGRQILDFLASLALRFRDFTTRPAKQARRLWGQHGASKDAETGPQ